MTESQVLALFAHPDQICRSAFPRVDRCGRVRRFALISYPTWDLCEEAINLLHMTDCQGRKLILHFPIDDGLRGVSATSFLPPLPLKPPYPYGHSDWGFGCRDFRSVGLDIQELITTLIARKLQSPVPQRLTGLDLSHLSREDRIRLLDQSRRWTSPELNAGQPSPTAAQGVLGFPKRGEGAVYFEDEE
jgi:hypothetical protein